MRNLTIAFFHLGYEPYQHYTLQLAMERTPRAKVVLLTDTPSGYPKGVEVVDIRKKYEADIAAFKACYEHRSTNSYMFEHSSLLRWIIYADWWKENACNSIFVADSDVMIFSDLYEERKAWLKYDYTLSQGTAGGQSFWNNPGALEKLRKLILFVYTYPDDRKARSILGHYDNLQKAGLPGGVCDMTFLDFLRRRSGYRCGETIEPTASGMLDHNILMAQGFEHDGTRKVVRWKDGTPYCRHNNGQDVKMHTLHMSCSKDLIEDFYNQSKVRA